MIRKTTGECSDAGEVVRVVVQDRVFVVLVRQHSFFLSRDRRCHLLERFALGSRTGGEVSVVPQRTGCRASRYLSADAKEEDDDSSDDHEACTHEIAVEEMIAVLGGHQRAKERGPDQS